MFGFQKIRPLVRNNPQNAEVIFWSGDNVWRVE